MQGLDTEREIQLSFNLAGIRNNSIRVAKFSSKKEKEKYVVAENAACSVEYWNLVTAISQKERARAKEKLDNARWAFYNTWINQQNLDKMVG